MQTAKEVQIVKCSGGWWLAQNEPAKLAATGKSEAEAVERLNQIVAICRRILEAA